MRLELRTSGGFAGLVGRPAVVVETDGLGPLDRDRIEQAVAAARVRGSDPPTGPPSGADLLEYRVSISPSGGAGGGSEAETLRFTDPVDDPAWGSLLDLITELGQERTDG